jgi:hypothetical protein
MDKNNKAKQGGLIDRTISDNIYLLTPKIGTGKRLTCEPNLAEEHHSAGGFPQSIRRGVSGREYIVIRQKNCSTGESGKHSTMRDDVDWI